MLSDSEYRFDKKPLINAKAYVVHKVYKNKNNEEFYARVFNQSIIDKYGINDALDFNIQVLTESPTFFYPDYFLHIDNNLSQDNCVILITKTYEYRLDQFIASKGPQSQKNAMVIFEHIIKAVYSFVMAGYWHRSLRAEHFVYSEGRWKIQSLVYDQMKPQSGLNCQYLYNPEYQPPEAYQRPNFTEEELDQKTVWDLGCILIHLIMGSHRLKNEQVLKKFKNEPFSFKKLGAQIDAKLSKQLKQFLGKMCHYQQKERMRLNEMIISGFFSKQVSQHYQKNKEEKRSKIFLGSQSSLSVTLSIRNRDNKPAVIDELPKIIQDSIKKSQKQQNILASIKKSNIESNEQFRKNLYTIAQQDQNSLASLIKKQSQMTSKFNSNKKDEQTINEALNIYKNYLDRAHLLQIGGKRFEQMKDLFTDKAMAEELIDVTIFSLNFVRAMYLCQLAFSMNENKPFFEFHGADWQVFHGTPEYSATKKYVNLSRNEALKDVQIIRNKLISEKNRFVAQKHNVGNFVRNYKPGQKNFQDIKEPYRRILKISYDIVADHYTINKSDEWAKLGMYITFCLAIDKMYIPTEFKDNFKFFFAWSNKNPSKYVSLYDFQMYLETAPRLDLVQNSRYIMRKFYEI